MVFILSDDKLFPDPELARDDGLLAVGGDLSLERLVNAYAKGIFPWYCEGDPILWWSPDPRLILEPSHLHISKSLRRVLTRKKYQITFDQAFCQVIEGCAYTKRSNHHGTWIVPEMIDAYISLHEEGLAHSVESWFEGKLVGGLYGVSMGRIFFGESMFTVMPDASKVAFCYLVKGLQCWGFDLIDCQITTSHLLRFGAREIPRREFLMRLQRSLKKPTIKGRWVMPDHLEPF